MPLANLDLSKYRQHILHKNDLVITRSGRVGTTAVFEGFRLPVIPGAFLIRFRLNSEVADPHFYRYFFNSNIGQELLLSVASGSVQQNLNITSLHGLFIPVPPIPKQRAIARILGSLDDKIEANRRMNQTLEALARTLFKSWFVDFDPVRAKAEGRAPAGMDAETAALFPDGFEENEGRMVPKGWMAGQFGDVAENARRSILPTEIDPFAKYIALEHMPKRCIALSEWSDAGGLGSNKLEFKQGEILFGKLRPYFYKVGVAPVNGVCSTDIVVVRPSKAEWFGFVLEHISSTPFVEYTNAGSTGTKMPRTSWNEMARYPLAIPPESIAMAFNAQVRPAIEKIIASIYESWTLATLRDALLPKLIRGEIRMNDTEKLSWSNGYERQGS